MRAGGRDGRTARRRTMARLYTTDRTRHRMSSSRRLAFSWLGPPREKGTCSVAAGQSLVFGPSLSDSRSSSTRRAVLEAGIVTRPSHLRALVQRAFIRRTPRPRLLLASTTFASVSELRPRADLAKDCPVVGQQCRTFQRGHHSLRPRIINHRRVCIVTRGRREIRMSKARRYLMRSRATG